MASTTKYLKIDLAKKNAFSEAEWVESVGSATAFKSRLAATGARSMMPGATAVVSEGEKFFVVSQATRPQLSDERLAGATDGPAGAAVPPFRFPTS